MKFQVGDRVKYYNSEKIGVIVKQKKKSSIHSIFNVKWDDGKSINHYGDFLILVSSSGYSDFQERIKDRMGIL